MKIKLFKTNPLILLLCFFTLLDFSGTFAQVIKNEPIAVINPTQLNFTFDSTESPASQTCTLSNNGDNKLTYQISVADSASSGNAAQAIKKFTSFHSPKKAYRPFAPGRVIVGLKANASTLADISRYAAINTKNITSLALAKNPFTGKKTFSKRRIFLITIGDKTSKGVLDAIAILQKDQNVLYAEPDYILKALDTTPNDPDFNLLYGLQNTGQNSGLAGCDISAPEAWDHTTGSRQVVVGIIDTGIDYEHPDLKSNIWTNPQEIAGNNLDDDNNGYIDDIHGWDFANNDNDPMDDHYHGTHCAGTIAAVGNNGVGITGVSWYASLAALKFMDASGSGYTSNAINAINYANAMGMPITSNSWGGDEYSQSLYEVINNGGLFVAAAGNDYLNDNDSNPIYPASYTGSNIIAVAATDDHDDLAYFSNYGATSVDLGAPGVSIWSCSPNSGYRYLSGTSMAAPHVAGAAALLLSANPQLTTSQLKNVLLNAVDPVNNLIGKVLSNGRLNIHKALDQISPAWLSFSPSSGIINSGSSQNITVTVDPVNLTPGTWTQTLRILTNDSKNPNLSLPVTVTINESRYLKATPASYNFGNVDLNQTQTTSLTLRNSGNSPTTVGSITSNNSAFSYTGSTPLIIPANSSAEINIAFTPTISGLQNTTLTINSNAQNNPELQVALSGNGVLSGLSISPLRFSETLLPDASVSRSLTLTNASTKRVTYTLAAEQLSWITATPNQGTVVPGASATITIKFDATGLSSGNYSGNLILSTDAEYSKTIPCSLKVSSDLRRLSITPQNYDWGSVLAGQSSSTILTLSNAGNLATVISAITLDNSQFSHNIATPLVIPSSSTARIAVTYTPTSTGASTATLTITSNANDNPVLKVNLSGTGVANPYLVQPDQFTVELRGNSSLTGSLRLKNNTTSDTSFSIKRLNVASVNAQSSGGPDDFGYSWKDSDLSDGPAYTWQEISTTGTRLTQADGDDAIEAINLGFGFPYYDQIFNTVYVSSNGFLTFEGASLNPYINYSLPCISMPGYSIAGFHDDLYPNRQGEIYYLSDSDRLIVQYTNVAIETYGTATFQIVLEKDGSIRFYYHTMTGTLSLGTVGIQNGTRSVGLTIAYNKNYIKNNLAIAIQPPVFWLDISPVHGIIPATGSTDVSLTFKTNQLTAGTYKANLEIYLDGQSTPITVPCTLTVSQ